VLKNITEPVRVWTRGPKITAIEYRSLHPQRDKPAIAVLPFDNLSPDPAQEFLADGLVEDIITALSRFDSVSVISRRSRHGVTLFATVTHLWRYSFERSQY
jgi:adenylate cyclase